MSNPAETAASAVTALFDKHALADLVLVLDLGGTFVFAISGAMAGVRERLDLFGVLVLSFAAASAGGIARDLLIGAVPPAAISDWRYLGVAVTAGVMTFLWSSPVARHRRSILLFDAVGLAFFAVAGTEKALAFRLHPLMAALLGMLTGIGGGIARDLLVASTPAVLKGDLYAVAPRSGQRARSSPAAFSAGRWCRPRSAVACFASASGSWRYSADGAFRSPKPSGRKRATRAHEGRPCTGAAQSSPAVTRRMRIGRLLPWRSGQSMQWPAARP